MPKGKCGIRLTRTDLSQNDVERFADKIWVNERTECHRWMSEVTDQGYPMFTFKLNGKKKRVSALRVAYVLAHGEVDENRFVKLTCGTIDCVNPAHLTLHVKRGRAKKRGKLHPGT